MELLFFPTAFATNIGLNFVPTYLFESLIKPICMTQPLICVTLACGFVSYNTVIGNINSLVVNGLSHTMTL